MGIIEYIILFLAYPLTYCDPRMGRALMCLAGGDGLAGFGSLWEHAKRLPFNQKKSYIGTTFAFAGSLLYIVCYEDTLGCRTLWKDRIVLSLVAAISETLPVQQHDNIVVPGLVYLY